MKRLKTLFKNDEMEILREVKEPQEYIITEYMDGEEISSSDYIKEKDVNDYLKASGLPEVDLEQLNEIWDGTYYIE